MNPALTRVVDALSEAHADAMAFGAGGVAHTLSAMQTLVYSLACEPADAAELVRLASVALAEAAEQSATWGSSTITIRANLGNVYASVPQLAESLRAASEMEPVR